MSLNLALEETGKSILLLNKISLLILSKYILSDFIFFGYTNINQSVAYNFGFEEQKKSTVATLDFIRIFRNYDKETQDNENLTYIYENCAEFKNVLISEPFLGQRAPQWDIVETNYSFVAFQMKDKYRFVFRSNRPTILHEVNPVEVWRSSNKLAMGNNFECSYHNDDYFLGINFHEFYLISFYIQEEGLGNLKVKQKLATRSTSKEKKPTGNKIKKGADVNSLFQNFLI
jgi:hypothetical protein